MPTESTKSEQKTVQFDVGGQMYRVSKSLIEQHEETMLARLVSDTWLANPDATIFIDRDGERFKYVLDYLRYGKVSLPLTVPREMFLLDMEYYGFSSVNNDTARSTLAPTQIDNHDASKQAALHLRRCFQHSLKETSEKNLESLVLEKATEYAHQYFGQQMEKTGALRVHVAVKGVAGSEEHAKTLSFRTYLNDEHNKKEEKYRLLISCLARFGLQLKKNEPFHMTIDTM